LTIPPTVEVSKKIHPQNNETNSCSPKLPLQPMD
jgi:hypothetical protein